jgi:hypothetical protein
MSLRQFAFYMFFFTITALTVDAHDDRPAVETSADVIVYGSTPGGFCAAIAAAREGASVILLEPTEHVGGLSTGGLSHCDSNQMRRETLMGLFDEWHTRIVKDYTDRGLPAPYNAALKDSAKWTFEPHVAMRVTMSMLQEAGVVLRTSCYLKSVTKQGSRITSIVTKKGTFHAKVFVDGTYEGDLMAASGVDWTIGREGRDEFGESYAGKQFPKKEMNINGFDENGSLLPLVTTSDAALYVRESRRMKGMYIILQKDILDSPKKDDPIAISSFPIDSHDCQRVALKDGGVINEGTIFPVRVPGTPVGYAYHVPYRSVLPNPGLCTNLLVPVALSCTHVGISSLRIEGTWMAIGQGAGIAAALSAKRGVDVQELQYPLLRERLVSQGQVLELPGAPKKTAATKEAAVKEADFISVKSFPGIVLDDEDATFVGEWTHSTNFKPSIAGGYHVHGAKDVRNDGKAKATCHVKVPKTGEYQVRVAYSAHETRAKNVPVIISSGGHETKLIMDQTKLLPSGDRFQHIGNVELKADSETTLQIQTVGTTGFVILDAIQLIPVPVASVTR